MEATLLPVAARKKAALSAPDTPGASFFYKVRQGWQTDALRLDKRIIQVRTTRELETAMDNIGVKTIMVPGDSSITRAAALQICSRSRQSKTIFYEVGKNE